MIDPNEILNEMIRMRQNAAKRVEANKHILFDLFDTYGVDTAYVDFDGSGDSGSIGGINLASDNDKNLDKNKVLTTLNDGQVLESTSISQDGWKENFAKGKVTVSDLIEGICLDILKAFHEGWENNSGAHGDITFDAGNRTVYMEFFERAEKYFEHTL